MIFLNDLMGPNEPNILKYMANGKGNEQYDFKTNGPDGEAGGIKNIPDNQKNQYKYRGVLFSVDTADKTDNVSVIASARDIGNFGAGYIGEQWFNLGAARAGFDTLQSAQQGQLATGRTNNSTGAKIGHNVGIKSTESVKLAITKINHPIHFVVLNNNSLYEKIFKILIVLVCFIAGLFLWFDQSRSFFKATNGEYITMWKRYGGACYLIPR